ncbi:MAG: hypothetical protein ABIJ41_02325 [Candidatus Omnitrophota bacterium]
MFEYDINKVSEELHIRTEILNRLVHSFANTLSQKIITLEEAVTKNDIITMRAILHEIRGTSGNLRLESVLAATKIMHEAVKAEKDSGSIPGHFKVLKEKSDEFKNYIESQAG